jgi:hypothetical protein
MISVMLAAALRAATPPAGLAEQLAANRTDLSVSAQEMRLAGPGTAVLAKATDGAQYVFLGEDHGLAQVAQLATALFAMLQPRGFDALALEVGPFTARQLATALHQSDPLQAHQAFLRDHPMSVAFYNTREEFDFLRAAAKASGERLRVMGFDQELMGNSKALLETVRDQDLPAGTAARVGEMLIAEQDALADARGSGRPDLLYMMTAPLQDLLDLQTALRRARLDSTPIDSLLASRAVYEESGRSGYASNVQRSLLMRQYFTAADSAEPGRKILFKGGGEHAFKGLNPLRNRDLGNFIAELAEGRQQRSVHILIFAASGRQLVFTGAGKPMKALPIDLASKDSPLQSVKPLIQAAARHRGSWSLFDLRPLRAKFRSLGKVEPDFEKVLYGFDFAIVVPKADPSHEIGAAE